MYVHEVLALSDELLMRLHKHKINTDINAW